MMRWEDERYVRVYTRDTVDWQSLSFDAQALLLLLLRKVDRAGLLPLGKHGKRGVAIAIGHAREWERLAPALEELLSDGCVTLTDDGTTILVPNFIAAQESTASAVQRTREYRERERDRVRAGLPSAAQKAAVIYFIQSEHGGPIKVGRADDLAKRVMGLQTGRPDKLVVLAAAEGTRQDERNIHAAFAEHRERGEWFHPTPVLLSFIRSVTNDPARICDVTGHVSGYVASPETSHVTSPVTPSLAVPCLAEPSHADSLPVAADAVRVDAVKVLVAQAPLLPEAVAEEKPQKSTGTAPEALQALWNRLAVPKGLQHWKSMSPARRGASKASLAAVPDLAKWEAWLAYELARPWNLGQNGTGWRADVDWLLRSKTRDLVADFNPATAPLLPASTEPPKPKKFLVL
jgi:hypothetical protein